MGAPLVENTIHASPPEGRRQPFAVKIWSPRPHPEGDFTCRVDMSHKPDAIEIGGVDSLQSLVLAIAYLNAEFRSLVRSGWLFYLDDNDETRFDPSSTYFPPPNWKPAA